MNFLTRAHIRLEDHRAMLSQGKAELQIQILSAEEALFEVISANQEPPQAQQPDTLPV
ncbi:hypothetical protein MYX78_05835 [Acidobacteria bacterium AH-259-G07]|nr:hypothetical protein [Acidobacteria bacterium AH-259-G07]